MILTLTANPSIDRTVTLPGPLVRGGVQQSAVVSDQAGGKGINISRAAVAAGVETVAVLPAASEDAFVTGLRRDGIDVRPQPAAGPVRVNLALTEPDGTTTKVNEPGARVTADDLEALADTVAHLAGGARFVVLAGSLPPGAPADWYADLVSRLSATGTDVAVDTSGAPLAAFADRLSDAAPYLMKPNDEELASMLGVEPAAVGDPEQVAALARGLVDGGVRHVLATLGGAGAVLVTADGAWHATPPPTRVLSTVGAGDSSLFGFLLAGLRQDTPEQSLRLAVAYGSAAAGLPGTTIPAPSQVHPEQVDVRPLHVTGGTT